jgi:small subunit ribosomal protein S16
MGAKKRPFYRIVVTEKLSKRDGRFIEILGFYNPIAQPSQEAIRLNADRIAYWQERGAQPTETVRELFNKHLKPAA